VGGGEERGEELVRVQEDKERLGLKGERPKPVGWKRLRLVLAQEKGVEKKQNKNRNTNAGSVGCFNVRRLDPLNLYTHIYAGFEVTYID